MTSTAETLRRPDPHVISTLLREQAPHLAHLPVTDGPAEGSSNWVFRLGADLAVRLPRDESSVPDLVTEIRWLPRLSPHLSAAVPEILVAGEPTATFPHPWAVVSWVPGDPPGDLDDAQQRRFAETLGSFLLELHSVDTAGAPTDPDAWGYRCGEPVTDTIDRWADEAATALSDVFDPSAVREAWRRLREVREASHPVCWVHADLSAENLLVHPDGSLAGVVDFGAMGVGDRSVDLLYAWSMLGRDARDVLRATAEADDATWSRARTWAFVGPGLLTIDSYRETMPARTARLTTMVETVAAEVGVRLR